MEENTNWIDFDDMDAGEAADVETTKKKIERLFSPEKLERMFKKKSGAAKKLILDRERFEAFLHSAEEKLKDFPAVGEKLSNVPVMIEMLWCYFRGEYRAAPAGTIIAVVIAVAYWLSPIDLIPDALPVIGMLDDAAVIAGCLKMIGSDLDDFRVWRAAQRELNE